MPTNNRKPAKKSVKPITKKPARRAPQPKKASVGSRTMEMEAALGLYLAGMEMAKADENIERKELEELIAVAQKVALGSKSAFVRNCATLVAQYDELKTYYEADNRQHVQVWEDVAKLLAKQKIDDRMRYLTAAFTMIWRVAGATGGGWFEDSKISDEEHKHGKVIWFLLGGGIDINEVKAWTDDNGV
jgi:hypothetical protein